MSIVNTCHFSLVKTVMLSPGVNTENREHSSYLTTLCKDVYEILSKRIDEAIEERSRKEVNLNVYEEVCQHIEFAKSRCEYFHGRGEELNAIHNYLKGNYFQ